MAMVRPSVKVEERERKTTKILNLYNKSAEPNNKTGSMVVTTSAPEVDVGSEINIVDFDDSEITVIFEDEIETLYVGPVEISEEEELQRRLMEEEAAAKAAKDKEPMATGGSLKNQPTLLNAGVARGKASSPAASAALRVKGGITIKSRTGQTNKNSSSLAVKVNSPVASNGSDSGIDNCSSRDDNKAPVKSSAQPKDSKTKIVPQKRGPVQQKLTDMVIKRRGRPPGASTTSPGAAKQAKSATEITTTPTTTTTATGAAMKKSPATPVETATPVRKAVVAVAKPKATVSPKQQFECDLCEEVFSREDTIVDHYQSYHRVDPKKRSIKPRVNIPKEPSPEPEPETEQVPEEEEEEEELPAEVDLFDSTAAGQEDEADDDPEDDPFDDQDDDDDEEYTPVKAKRGSSAAVAVKKEKAPGVICGQCNLTFRTIALLGRHMREMHVANDEDEDMAEDQQMDYQDEDEEESEESDDDDEVIPAKKMRGKENRKISAGTSATTTTTPSTTSATTTSSSNSAAVAKKRGRPRKVDSPSSPRILNSDKPSRSRPVAIAVEQPKSVSVKTEPLLATTAGKRGRKRAAPVFAQDDDDTHEVVPKPQPVKRNSRRMQNKIEFKDEKGQSGILFVDVVNENDTGLELGDEEDEEEAGQTKKEPVVYKIQECTSSVDKDGTPKYACPLCDLTFTRRYSLEPHIQRVHQKLRNKECQYCDRKFLAQGDLTRHMAIHTGTKPYGCSVTGCPFRFVSRSDLAKHELRHTAGVPRTYVCGQCDKSFERPYDLRRHQMTHKDLIGQVEFKHYKCDQCDRDFSRKDEYRAHMYRHLGVKPLKCHVCGKPFVDQSNCAKHVKGHGPVTYDGPDDPLVCGDCGVKFTNQSAISRHVTRCQHERSEEPVSTVPQLEYFEDDVK